MAITAAAGDRLGHPAAGSRHDRTTTGIDGAAPSLVPGPQPDSTDDEHGRGNTRWSGRRHGWREEIRLHRFTDAQAT
jgi:hypothetical protein